MANEKYNGQICLIHIEKKNDSNTEQHIEQSDRFNRLHLIISVIRKNSINSRIQLFPHKERNEKYFRLQTLFYIHK